MSPTKNINNVGLSKHSL